jgi:3-oxoacyl-[acyl-carrier-protein] synthase III
MHSRIVGTGSWAPRRTITNRDLERLFSTGPSGQRTIDDTWIVERTGIHERRAADDDESTSDLALAAARKALEAADLRPEAIDLIVLGTVTPDCPTPATATFVQARLGAKNALAFDVSAACAGALVALSVADRFVSSGKSTRALVIGADLLTRSIDWTDRNTAILFGDAAGALVLAPCGDEFGVLSMHLHSDGALAPILTIPGPGTRGSRDSAIRMNGREVFRVAVRSLVAAAHEALAANGITTRQIDHVVGHQANLRIIEAVMARLSIPMDRFHLTLDRYGNTSAAAIPMCIDEALRAGKFKSGDKVLLLAAGAGFVWGSSLIRW